MSSFRDDHAAGEDNDYFDVLFDWTKRKHDILKDYAATFTKIIGDLYSVDLFAGRGEHRDGNSGSPLVTAQIAQDFSRSNRSYRLRCINVEKNPEHFAHLEEATASFPRDLVKNYCGDFAGRRTLILQQLGSTAALFFLDPFGVEGLEWDILQPLLRRTYTTELLINFNMPYARRLAGFVSSNAPDAKSKVKTLTDILGSNEWAKFVPTDNAGRLSDEANERSTDLGDFLTDIYEKQLRNAGFPHVYHYPVRAVDTGAIKYHLVFATRNCKGVVAMSDVVASVDERFQTERRDHQRSVAQPPNAIQPSLFELPEPQVVHVESSNDHSKDILDAEEVGRTMLAALRNEPAHRLPYLQLRCCVASQFFGRARKPIYSAQIRALQHNGLIRWDGSETRLPGEKDHVHLVDGAQ